MNVFERLFKLEHTQHQLMLMLHKNEVVLQYRKYASSRLRILVPESEWETFMRDAGQDELKVIDILRGSHQKNMHPEVATIEMDSTSATLQEKIKKGHRVIRPSPRARTKALHPDGSSPGGGGDYQDLAAHDYIVVTLISHFIQAGPVFKEKVKGRPKLQPYRDVSKIIEQVRRGIEANYRKGMMIPESNKRAFERFLDAIPCNEKQYEEASEGFKLPGASEGQSRLLLWRKPTDPEYQRLRQLESNDLADEVVLEQRPTVRSKGMSSSELQALSQWTHHTLVREIPQLADLGSMGRRRAPRKGDVVVVGIEKTDANKVPFRLALVIKVITAASTDIERGQYRIQFYGQQQNGVALPYSFQVGKKPTRFHLFLLPDGTKDQCSVRYDQIGDTLDRGTHYRSLNHHTQLELYPAGREIIFANPLFRGQWDKAKGKYCRKSVALSDDLEGVEQKEEGGNEEDGDRDDREDERAIAHDDTTLTRYYV